MMSAIVSLAASHVFSPASVRADEAKILYIPTVRILLSKIMFSSISPIDPEFSAGLKMSSGLSYTFRGSSTFPVEYIFTL